MKIRIQLRSDLCTYSGEGYNVIVDTDVVYDKYGIPYIPAKRLKGCIREAAMELADFGIIDKRIFQELFGHEGDAPSAFVLSDAYPENYDGMVHDLKLATKKYTAQQVLDLFTYTRYQTAVSLESGAADETSLRSMRVVKEGMVFEAEINWRELLPNAEKEKKFEALEKAVSVVKHIGCSRTRGLGLVDMRLVDKGEENKAEVDFDESEIADKNKISYEIHLDSPVICKESTGNQAVTQDYIAGSKVLGLLAGQLGEDGYRELMEGSEFIVSNAYIMCGSNRAVPARKSWQKEKDQGYVEHKMVVLDRICDPEVGEKQMTPSGIHYVDKTGTALSVDTEISYHHQRPDDKSIGRASGRDSSTFYQLAAIQAGQRFGGYILADRNQVEKIVQAVQNMENVRMGYGKNAEFGKVTFRLTKTEPVDEPAEESNEIMHDAVLTLVSDLIMYNKSGTPSTSISCLQQYLAEALEINDSKELTIEKPFLGFDTIGGYNTTWGRMKPLLPSIAKGSVFVLHFQNGCPKKKLQELQNCFLGERVSEGYGEVRVEEIPEKAEYTVSDLVPEDLPDEKQSKTNLLRQLEEREEKHRLEQQIREIAANVKLQPDIFRNAVSRVRLIFKTAAGYQELCKQVEAITSKDTRESCEKIVKSIDPVTLAEGCSVFKNEKQENDKQAAYKFIYHVYLTELKYHAKIQQKSGKGGKKK